MYHFYTRGNGNLQMTLTSCIKTAIIIKVQSCHEFTSKLYDSPIDTSADRLQNLFALAVFSLFYLSVVLSLSGRADPDCALGHLLKTLFRNDDFMDKLVNSYIMSAMEEFDLNCIASRVLLNAMPGLESAAVFQDMVRMQLGYHLQLNPY